MDRKTEIILNDYHEKICPDGIFDPKFSSHYEQYDNKIRDIFSVWHGKIINLVNFMNTKAVSNHHFNAGPSREFSAVIEQISELNKYFENTQYKFGVIPHVDDILKYVRTYLQDTGGSHIPDDYEKIEIDKYEPIFFIMAETIKIKNNQNLSLKVIGEGAFAVVSKYTDPEYNIDFAIKQLKRNVNDREKERFKEEYRILSELRSPYILQVYSFDEDRQRYVMEYCDTTLKNYYDQCNSKISFLTRKRIAQQFLYAISYLHFKKILHRDLSYHNILLKVYEGGVLGIKLSDFGLVKTDTSDFTKTDTEIKGTIIDPSLDSFKNYSLENEIYAIGVIINYIFLGKKNFSNSVGSKLEFIVGRCTDSGLQKRYRDVQEVLNDVDKLSENDLVHGLK